MIFDTIKFGIFTADDFFTAQKSGDYSKFTALPIDLRKQFISDVIDLHPNQERNIFKQAAFDFIDGKIIEKQFRDAWWKYWSVVEVVGVVQVAVVAVVAVVAAAVSAGEMPDEYYRPYFEQHAKHLNKVIQEYERS